MELTDFLHLTNEHGAGFDFIFSFSKPTIMNKNLILKTDILDIIFENRNKAYGAYSLRKLYPHRLKLALGFMFLFAIAFSAFTFLPEKDNYLIAKPHIIDPEFGKVKDPKEEPKKPEVKKPEIKKTDQVKVDPKPAVVNQKTFTNNIAIVDKSQKSDSIVTLLPTDVISTVTVNVPSATPKIQVAPAPPAPPTGPKIDVNSPLDGTAVDVMPAFPGGLAALQKFLEKNLNNPYDMENGEIVSVKVKFVVGYNGKLQTFETVQDGGEVYNKEVVRVLKKMPDWEPGKARGENVSVYYTIPVKFVMSN